MILIQYPLTEGQDPDEEMEDAIDAFMGDMDYMMCGSGGVTGEVRDLEFEGDSNEHELELINSPRHLEMLQERAGAELTITHSPWDDEE